jgi:hypothetical protein
MTVAIVGADVVCENGRPLLTIFGRSDEDLVLDAQVVVVLSKVSLLGMSGYF